MQRPTRIARALLGAVICMAVSAGAGLARPGTQGTDWSPFVVEPTVLGDDWNIISQQDEPTLFRSGFTTPAVAGYTVTYSQTPVSDAMVALYAFPDHAAALASLSDPYVYWGHGNTTLVPLSGIGDDQSFRAYGVGRGPNAGITFVDGNVVVYVRAEDDAASDTSGATAVCDALAAAEDALLQATPLPVPVSSGDAMRWRSLPVLLHSTLNDGASASTHD